MKIQNKNFLYNLVYQIFIFIIPMITIPYISRVLGVESIGIYSYSYSIVNYFMLFSMLGINNYGSRIVAKSRNDKVELSRNFYSIYIIQFVLNVICIILYLILLIVYNYEFKNIMFINLIFLISVMFDINWFFFGKENFKITITRNIIIKIITLFMIFLFVKERGDLWKYTLIMSLGTLISQMYLWIFIKKDLVKVKIKISDCKKHIKSIIILFIPVLAYSIYRIMDKTMLGIFASNIELGYYESAEKIINIPVSIITALGTVMMPHMSKKTEEEIKEKIFDTFELTFFMILPMVIGLIFISTDFSNIFFGLEYKKTGILIKILSISTIFSSIANVIRTNYLIPCSKDKIYVKSTIFGAIVNLIANLLFIPILHSYGACIGTILAEFIVMIYQIIFTYKNLNYKKIFKRFIFYLKKNSYIILILVFSFVIKNVYLRLTIQIVFSIIIYLIINIHYIKYEFLSKK